MRTIIKLSFSIFYSPTLCTYLRLHYTIPLPASFLQTPAFLIILKERDNTFRTQTLTCKTTLFHPSGNLMIA